MSVLKRFNGTSWEIIGPQITSTRFDDINHMIASEYSSTSTYNVGDYVVQSDKLYKCISAIKSAEEWNAAHWKIDNFGDELSEVNRQLSDEIVYGNLNQHVKVRPFVIREIGDSIGELKKNRSDLSIVENGALKVTRNSTQTTTSYGFYGDIENNPEVNLSGHKIYLNVSGVDITYATHFVHVTVQALAGSTSVYSENVSNISDGFEKIVTLSDNANRISLLLYPGTTVENGEYITVDYIQWIDLTAMFGTGNEPTLSEFKAVYNAMPYPFLYPSEVARLYDEKMLINKLEESSYINKGSLESASNLNDIKDNSLHSVSTVSQPENYPLDEQPGYIISSKMFGREDYIEQLCLPFYTGAISLNTRKAAALQARYFQNTWSNWSFFKLVPRDKNAKYYAFGDSTTWGYSSDHNHAQSPWNYPFIVGDLIGVDVHNMADPAQGLIKDWSVGTTGNYAIIPTINDMIANGDFENTALITVGWAYNDFNQFPSLNMGSPTDPIPDSTTGITTFLGYYAKILDVLQSAAPTACVILITGFGFTTALNPPSVTNKATHQYDAQSYYAFADGNKTIKQVYDALEEMANYNGFYCINQAKGGVINKVNANTIIGDNIHPTYDNYKLYGNFIASRIASIYQNVKVGQ